MKRETYGLAEGQRIVLANCETDERGTLLSVNEKTGECRVRWDNGRTTLVDVDELIPEEGW